MAVGSVTFPLIIGGTVNKAVLQNLVLSLTLPSSAWVGAPVLQQNSEVVLGILLEGKPGPCPKAVPLFDYSSLVFTSPLFPD